jgi:hypothetical protein
VGGRHWGNNVVTLCEVVYPKGWKFQDRRVGGFVSGTAGGEGEAEAEAKAKAARSVL